MNLIGIKYVGKKPSRADTVAGTEFVWTRGQIHAVPANIAQKLIKHPDIWVAVSAEEIAENPDKLGFVDDGGNPDAVLQNLVLKQAEESGQETSEKEDEDDDDDDSSLVMPDLQAMTKHDLKAFAHRSFNINLELAMKKEDMIGKIVALRNGK
mgnify:CR=1 FL=1